MRVDRFPVARGPAGRPGRSRSDGVREEAGTAVPVSGSVGRGDGSSWPSPGRRTAGHGTDRLSYHP